MTDTSKIQFEQWHKRETQAFVAAGEVEAAQVMEGFKKSMWSVWQASRQSVVVEIKEAAPAPRHSSSYQEGMADGAEAATTAAIEAIQAAGLRCEVKS